MGFPILGLDTRQLIHGSTNTLRLRQHDNTEEEGLTDKELQKK